jgi:uncharacterized membrane protein (UPF0127 family)
MRVVNLVNLSHPFTSPLQALYCTSFLCRLRGLMFRRSLSANEGLLFVLEHESIINSSIHMMFMNFDISVIWLDARLMVVDKCLAKRWKPMYKPSAPAKYILETSAFRFEDFYKNDGIQFEIAS